jgi:hypothetical protein
MHGLPSMMLSSMRAETASELKEVRSRAKRRSPLVLAIAAVLTAPACSGLDIPIGPVDHSCPVVNSCQHAGNR